MRSRCSTPSILKGAFIGWILRDPGRIPGFFPISSKWVLVLFGLGAIQYARHPEGIVEYGKRTAAAAERDADRRSASPDSPTATADDRRSMPRRGAGGMSAVLRGRRHHQAVRRASSRSTTCRIDGRARASGSG